MHRGAGLKNFGTESGKEMMGETKMSEAAIVNGVWTGEGSFFEGYF